jgi:hypothetical protein
LQALFSLLGFACYLPQDQLLQIGAMGINKFRRQLAAGPSSPPTEALVAEIPEEKKNAPMPGGHDGGMGDMNYN